MAKNHDADGNVMGRTYANPVLDTRTYQVEFAGGKITELTTDVIAESIYTECNADRIEYLLSDLLVYYQKNDKAISLSYQHISV